MASGFPPVLTLLRSLLVASRPRLQRLSLRRLGQPPFRRQSPRLGPGLGLVHHRPARDSRIAVFLPYSACGSSIRQNTGRLYLSVRRRSQSHRRRHRSLVAGRDFPPPSWKLSRKQRNLSVHLRLAQRTASGILGGYGTGKLHGHGAEGVSVYHGYFRNSFCKRNVRLRQDRWFMWVEFKCFL